jgi:hypothetical protein
MSPPNFHAGPKQPRTVMVNVRFTADEAAVLDTIAGRLGVNGRAEVVRAGIDALIAARPGLAATAIAKTPRRP